MKKITQLFSSWRAKQTASEQVAVQQRKALGTRWRHVWWACAIGITSGTTQLKTSVWMDNIGDIMGWMSANNKVDWQQCANEVV